MSRFTWLALSLSLLLAPFATWSQPVAMFMGLGDLPGGAVSSNATAVSADGSTVVGYSASGQSSPEAFRWTAEDGMVGLGLSLPGHPLGEGDGSVARGVSGDGSVVVGSIGFPGPCPSEAFRWSSQGGMHRFEPTFTGCPPTRANDVSHDGSTIVGDILPSHVFRWTQATGVVVLQDFLSGEEAVAVSADGTAIAGNRKLVHAILWREGSGAVDLGGLPGGYSSYSAARDISADGRVVVGRWSLTGRFAQAMLWTEANGMIGLGPLASQIATAATGVSGDGTIVVGLSNLPFIWDAKNGRRFVLSVLVDDFGLNLEGWALHTAVDVSDDGLVIVGAGNNPDGNTEAWMAVLPPSCGDGLDNDLDGFVDFPDDSGCDAVDDPSEFTSSSPCDDGIDNDGDGLADFPHDPGCADSSDGSETDSSLPCDDGLDNDGDGRIDFDPVTFANPGGETTLPSGSGDPGCKYPTWFSEEPRCQDGIDNDGDGMMDYDAGLSRNGVADPGGPDPACVNPYDNREHPCGLGVELALLLPPLMWLYRRRGRRL